MLENLKPARVFYYFEQLCAIPHGSGNTKAISDYCVGIAHRLGLAVTQDEWNNVRIIKPAAKGYETHPSVIIQGHLDMVCEKDPDCDLDFMKDGLRLDVDGDWIFAHQTTLGGDDGIAIAMALAILEDPDLPAPAIEALFTTDEETGMDGAVGLDCTPIQGRLLLNIDSEEEGVLTVGCAGGARVDVTFSPEKQEGRGKTYEVIVDGLRGGHSGVEIGTGRYNANHLMGKFLSQFRGVTLCEINGGTKDNAITRSCRAVIVTESDVLAAVETFTRENANPNDPDFTLCVREIAPQSGYRADRVIAFLSTAPSGVVAMSADIEGLVETSLNLGVLTMKDGRVKARFSVRSGVNAKRDALCQRVIDLAQSLGGETDMGSHYPAWEYRKDSPLRDTMVEVYQRMYGCAPQVLTIHAGLECGLFCEKMEGLDAVSFGPDIQEIHTSRERLSISSTARTFDYLCQILKEL